MEIKKLIVILNLLMKYIVFTILSFIKENLLIFLVYLLDIVEKSTLIGGILW
jgi:hypothetical protein